MLSATFGPAAVPAIPVLLRATEDINPSVRSFAADTLGDIGQGEEYVVVPALERLLNDANGGPREYAKEALYRLGQPAEANVPEGIIQDECPTWPHPQGQEWRGRKLPGGRWVWF